MTVSWNNPGGWLCSGCGTWVMSGTTHACSTASYYPGTPVAQQAAATHALAAAIRDLAAAIRAKKLSTEEP